LRKTRTQNAVKKSGRQPVQVQDPGHSEVEGNEIADALANQGALLHISWANNIPIPLSQVKAVLKEKMVSEWQNKWSRLKKCETAKAIWPKIDKKTSEELINMQRTEIRRIVFAVSGHWPLGKHGKKLKLQVPEKCSQCDTLASEIDSLHFWGNCPALAKKRYKFLGSYFFDSLRAITKIDIKSKINFIKNSKFLG
jgi:hypothetical protein